MKSACLGAALALAAPLADSAESYPSKPVRMVVLSAPRGTPRTIIDRLNAELHRIVALPEVNERAFA